jgi:hypothetical protein
MVASLGEVSSAQTCDGRSAFALYVNGLKVTEQVESDWITCVWRLGGLTTRRESIPRLSDDRVVAAAWLYHAQCASDAELIASWMSGHVSQV